MGSINRVVIMGVIGREPELKTSRNGKPYVNLSLATYRRVKDENGVAQRETQRHKVMLWGKNAELCTSYLRKGGAVYVEGHLGSYQRDTTEGAIRQITIVGDQIQLIPGSRAALSVERAVEQAVEPDPHEA